MAGDLNILAAYSPEEDILRSFSESQLDFRAKKIAKFLRFDFNLALDPKSVLHLSR